MNTVSAGRATKNLKGQPSTKEKKKKRDTYDISKQGITATKIELAAAAIVEENKRRKKFNKGMWRKKDTPQLPMLRPSHARIYTRRARDEHGGSSGVMASNKYLCGRLSELCKVMREAGIRYPWRTQEAV
jgi:hypothetical protein